MMVSMKNRLLTLNKFFSRHPRLAGLSFWLVLTLCLALAALAFARLISAGGQSTWKRTSDSSQFHWLLANDGKRRGCAIVSDLARDSKSWELWGNGAGMPPLDSINSLCPDPERLQSDFGFNGGFWDKTQSRPVGICAGERGIHGAVSHPNGFAIAAKRAWIGPLVAHVQLSPLSPNLSSSATLRIQLNPRPIPRRAPCLIDPLAYPGLIQPDTPFQVAWLDRDTSAPLRFNSTIPLAIRHLSKHQAGEQVKLPPPGVLLWLWPLGGKAAPPPRIQIGERYQLTLRLEPVKGEVQLATSAGPRLLREGKVVGGLAGNGLVKPERTWRTAVGCDAKGRQLWVILLARGKDGQPGVTLQETAQTLLDLGAVEGLNLDGGSSTSVWSSKLSAELLALFPLQFQIHHAIFLRKGVTISPLQE